MEHAGWNGYSVRKRIGRKAGVQHDQGTGLVEQNQGLQITTKFLDGVHVEVDQATWRPSAVEAIEFLDSLAEPTFASLVCPS